MDVRKFEFLCGVVDKMQKEMQKAAVTLENEQKVSLMILLFRYSDNNGRDVDWEAISAMPLWEDQDKSFTGAQQWLNCYDDRQLENGKSPTEANAWLMGDESSKPTDLLTMASSTNSRLRDIFAVCLPFEQPEMELAGAALPKVLPGKVIELDSICT